MPIGILSSRWRSGSAHWDLVLAVEAWLCPLGSGLRGGGEEEMEEEAEEEEENNLADGEKLYYSEGTENFNDIIIMI